MIEIILNKSVGPFAFNTPISTYLLQYPPDEIGDYEPITNSVAYDYYNGDVVLFCEDGIIINIGIYFDCYLEGKNIYRANIFHFFDSFAISEKEQVPDDKIWLTDDEQQTVYEVSSLGLQLWVDDSDSIVSIMASKED